MVQTPYPSVAEDVHKAFQDLLGQQRLIIVSNRGPIEYRHRENGYLEASRGSGGVVTALSRITRFAKATWVASAMTDGDRQMAMSSSDSQLPLPISDLGARLRFVVPPKDVYDRHYGLFSNPILWFLQHSLWRELDRPNLWQQVEEGWERGYVPMNRAFAEAVSAELALPINAPYVMLHDYHLYLAPSLIRARAPWAILSHFIHIPWPPPEAWCRLPRPMMEAILGGLLANNIVAFQTDGSARNFLLTCQSFIPEAAVDFDAMSVSYQGHQTITRSYPISVDVDDLRARMVSAEVQQYKEKLLPSCGEHTIVRVDRLDPSKNIIAGFKAFDLFLIRHPELLGKVKFLAFLVPSRNEIPEYQRYTREVFRLVDEINRRHQTVSWQPIEVFYENNYAQALAGMSLYDVLLVNPIADGMNLVAKEGPVVNERDGVLVLSHNAGAYEELGREALAIDPGDIEGTATAMWAGLFLPPWERRSRARSLRRTIEERDVSLWLWNQLQDIKSVSQERSSGSGGADS